MLKKLFCVVDHWYMITRWPYPDKSLRRGLVCGKVAAEGIGPPSLLLSVMACVPVVQANTGTLLGSGLFAHRLEEPFESTGRK